MHIISKASIAAGFAMLFSLNAIAAGTVSPPDTPPTARTGTKNQPDTRKEMHEYWEKMSPEEREQVRNKMKDHWNNMSPQEREARRQEMRDNFKNMSPEERKQFDRDFGKQVGDPAPDSDYPDDSTVKTDRTPK